KLLKKTPPNKTDPNVNIKKKTNYQQKEIGCIGVIAHTVTRLATGKGRRSIPNQKKNGERVLSNALKRPIKRIKSNT
ncbi:hypothetical protein, partial [Streptococcus suis]